MAAARAASGRLAVAALSVALASGAWACAPAAVRGPDADGPERVYVVSQDDASAAVLDARDGSVLGAVDFEAMGYGANAKPHDVVADPDGRHWYVSLIGASRVVRLDELGRVVDEARFEAAGMLAIDPATDWLYVGRSMAAVDPPQRVGMVRRSAMALTEVDVLFQRPHAVAVAPRSGTVYVASLSEDRMAVSQVGSEDVALYFMDGPPHTIVQFAVSPDGHWLVGGGQTSGQLLVWDISGEEPERRATVELGGQPWHPSFTPGGEVWIPNLTKSSVMVVDASTWSVAATVTHPALVEPHGSAVSADGRTVFVTGRNTSGRYGTGAPGTVVAIDAATRRVRWVTEVGPYAAGVAVGGGGRSPG